MKNNIHNKEASILILSSAALTTLSGFIILIGLFFHLTILTRGNSGFISVAPNTAICFILCGFSLYLNTKTEILKALTISKIFSAIVFSVGLLTFFELITGINFNIDRWLLPVLFNNEQNNPNNMAGVTALNFILISIALYFNGSKKSNNLFLIIIALPLIDSLIAIAGYLYDVSSLYSFGSFYKLSYYTAGVFLILSTGVLFLYEDTIIIKLFKSDGISRILIRKFAPFFILLIIIMRVLTMLGSSEGFYTPVFGDALEIIANILILTGFIFWNAYTLQKLDTELGSSLKQNQLLASIVESTTDAITSKTLDGIITSWNEGSEKLYGYRREEIIGKSISLLIPTGKMKDYELMMEKVRNGMCINYHETIRKKKNGDIVNVSINVSPIKDSQGRVSGASSIARDITEQKISRQKLKNYNEQLQILNRLAKIISSSLEIENIFDSFIEELGRRIPFDRTSLILLNNNRNEYIVDRMWSSYTPILTAKQRRSVKNSAFEIILKNGLPFIERNLGEKGEFNETGELRKEGIKSRIIFPLKIQDEIIGFFTQASIQPNTYKQDDIDLLVSLSDFLSIAVQNSNLYEKIKKMNEELEQRVIARTWELEEANKELEAFAYSVSHDLKAPLRAIDGFAKVLIEDYGDQLDIEASRVLNIIIQNSQKMSKLINDLLAFSRTSRREVSLSKLNINEIIYSALAQLCSYTDDEDIEIDIKDDIPDATGDKNMVQLVYVNLLSNALKFSSTREKQKIEVGACEKGNEIVYYVKDNGVGFNMKYYDKLFGVFQRLHSEDEFEGTGVGLALVQKIIQKHGGKVWAESKLNKGTAFYFTLEKEREYSYELQ
ncbi:MAG: PAS domain S-box protein [Ignavibacteriae bacterium]|nr:MAG: PAS domain S-box protein [Ignavibacteriota bacterium]